MSTLAFRWTEKGRMYDILHRWRKVSVCRFLSSYLSKMEFYFNSTFLTYICACN